MIDAASGNNWLPVSDFRFVAVDVFERVFLAEQGFDINAFGVSRPAFLNPHVGDVAAGDAVAEPLVRAFVDDDEVELQADPDARPISFEIAVGKAVAISDGALMFHPGVRNFDQLVAIPLERVLAEILLKCLHHRFGLCELAFGLLQIFRQAVKIHGQIAQPIAEMFIRADVERHVVVVDRIADVPIVTCVAVAQIRLPDKTPV